ncbi:V-type ATP synthase subunit A [Candidatus Micrarchaeota archaeon]|nr:V-type ATP synthase subunit A [Candidatus Micrarchaeota archaeon]MBD3418154.1 V-type ATP synthase subunit A [Candidatus Micrarchaeota archaeon]
MAVKGKLARITGPVVVAKDLHGAKLYDVVRVGEEKLVGEIIKIVGNECVVQVYEDTAGLKPGEPVFSTGEPLSVELGPGILRSFYDGIQRPLQGIEEAAGAFITRGIDVPPLDHKKKWDFKATRKKGEKVEAGDILGEVKETDVITHKILATDSGTLTDISSGKYTLEDTIGTIDTRKKKVPLHLYHRWVVRKPRPYREKFPPIVPLSTGMRLVDTFAPIAKGGTAAIPGPFGSGKTVTQQSLAKWSDAEIVVYIGCGERGNEMTEVLNEFPKILDPKTGKPLMERTVLIANTSNMPVAAREASIYTGITLAEYYRDMGYGVSLMADSTSRWAEALREISGRLEEMPGEEGYPAYLARKLAEFYERAGRVKTLGSPDREGSVTVIGAVSPPGGDISEPVSQNTLRVTKVFLALDASLAHRRHFPALNWLNSYSLYTETLDPWYEENVGADWPKLRNSAMALLQKEAELQEIVQLVGPDALPEKEQAILLITKMIREDYLQQSAFHEVDAFATMTKQHRMLKNIMRFYERAMGAIDLGIQLKTISSMKVLEKIGRMKEIPEDKMKDIEAIYKSIDSEFDSLKRE